MFDNKEITKEKVKAILYAVYNEYVNDINDDIEYFEDIFKKEITIDQIEFGLEFLNKYIDKVEMVIDDELNNNKESEIS